MTTLLAPRPSVKTAPDPTLPPREDDPRSPERDSLEPAAVFAAVAREANRRANHGSHPAAPIALVLLRDAYARLWSRYQAECPDSAFWPTRI